jgi:hypothetical protein
MRRQLDRKFPPEVEPSRIESELKFMASLANPAVVQISFAALR